MKKLYLNIFGKHVFQLIRIALGETGFKDDFGYKCMLENDNEVSLVFSSGIELDKKELIKKVINKLNWFSRHIDEIYINLEDGKIEGLQAECIAKMLNGSSIEELADSYDETVLNSLRLKRLDPIAANAIELLKKQKVDVNNAANAKVNEIFAKRNEDIERLDNEIDRLREGL